MKKSDLRTGMRVRVREHWAEDRDLFIVIGDQLRNLKGMIHLSSYSIELKNCYTSKFDIVEVLGDDGSTLDPLRYGMLLWSRHEEV